MTFYTTKHTPANTVITANIPCNRAPTGNAPLPGETIVEYEKRMKHKAKMPNFVKDQNHRITARKAQRKIHVLRIVSDGRRFTARDVHKMMTNVSRETAHGYVADLVRSGEITCVEPNKSNLGAVYQLTSAINDCMVTSNTKGKAQ